MLRVLKKLSLWLLSLKTVNKDLAIHCSCQRKVFGESSSSS